MVFDSSDCRVGFGRPGLYLAGAGAVAAVMMAA
jgi:hypothetical protein